RGRGRFDEHRRFRAGGCGGEGGGAEEQNQGESGHGKPSARRDPTGRTERTARQRGAAEHEDGRLQREDRDDVAWERVHRRASDRGGGGGEGGEGADAVDGGFDEGLLAEGGHEDGEEEGGDAETGGELSLLGPAAGI